MRKNAEIFKKYKNTQNFFGYGDFWVFGFGFGFGYQIR